MNIYCAHYNHFKDVIVCKLNCPRESGCPSFQALYEEKGREIRWIVFKYMQKYPEKIYKIYLKPKKRRKQTMKQYVCVKEGQINVLSEEEVAKRTANGEFFQSYFELGREMELMIKLVPKKDQVAAKKKPAKKTENQ